MAIFDSNSSSSPSSYSERDQIRDLEYLKRLPASQEPDARVVNRLLAHDLISGIDYTLTRDSAMIWLTPRGDALMQRACGHGF